VVLTNVGRSVNASLAKADTARSGSDSKGFFVAPTVIETSDPKSITMVEEIFGPVLTVYPYPDEEYENAIDLCDGTTDYALTGAM
jgi:1-pyrroline-5-carboxylate dehydrogenase